MLKITVPELELWDERNERFIYLASQTLELEHSLASLSKWESTWCKSFLSQKSMTDEEILDYIRCMTITPNVDPEIYMRLSEDNITQINAYIKAPMTATTFSEDKSGRPTREIITAEIVYHWMITLNVPLECEQWHLNKLLAFLKVCSIKNSPPKRRSEKDIMSQNAALNAARRQQMNSRG